MVFGHDYYKIYSIGDDTNADGKPTEKTKNGLIDLKLADFSELLRIILSYYGWLTNYDW
jgi:hypothetical protein